MPTLDGWRAVAILAVLCCHAGWPTAAIAPYGAMGVSIFFALSGFLITRRLMDEGRIDLASFYRRRAFRILPPIIAYLAVLWMLGFRGQLLASLLFVRNYITPTAPQAWYTGHFWSLAIEEHFYLLWPASLYVAGFRRARWIAPALALMVAGWRAADLHYNWIGRLDPALRGSLARTDYRLGTLLFGCAIALVWDDPRVRALFEQVVAAHSQCWPQWLPSAARSGHRPAI